MTYSVLVQPGAGSRRTLEMRACVLRQPGQAVEGDRTVVVVDPALAGVEPALAGVGRA